MPKQNRLQLESMTVVRLPTDHARRWEGRAYFIKAEGIAGHVNPSFVITARHTEVNHALQELRALIDGVLEYES